MSFVVLFLLLVSYTSSQYIISLTTKTGFPGTYVIFQNATCYYAGNGEYKSFLIRLTDYAPSPYPYVYVANGTSCAKQVGQALPLTETYMSKFGLNFSLTIPENAFIAHIYIESESCELKDNNSQPLMVYAQTTCFLRDETGKTSGIYKMSGDDMTYTMYDYSSDCTGKPFPLGFRTHRCLVGDNKGLVFGEREGTFGILAVFLSFVLLALF
ncbi:hypothetical protein EIN_164650 [Entamoeba invadens IP1]|uniref:ZP domain-containing protein n=1 Tax=Entamoeba invadens IP1 TaxID=370355 RepID=A0A0A1U4F4_ENTIV|nr:hypothetical protein EIN_164650 [Entamoeba invadens IP1]ELP89045.1 hypothetical protein EIN_164650 [Entamoeba invadens IP1]|eukprot:XP_004255816.1 hypothetical protein EIN_164650 [Entamoeba invadens IP1]